MPVAGAALLCAFHGAGCGRSIEELRRTEYSTWTAEECMAVIMRNTHHNLKGEARVVYALVTPFTPEVVIAIGRMKQLKEAVSDSLTYEFIQRLTKDGSGVYIDEHGVLWDARGNRFTGTRDSLMVMVSLTNQLWPCQPPTVNGVPLLRMSDTPCETPDITALERHMFLRTADGDTIYPKTVWGRRNSILTTDENLLVVFDLRSTGMQEGLFFHIDAFDQFNHRSFSCRLE